MSIIKKRKGHNYNSGMAILHDDHITIETKRKWKEIIDSYMSQKYDYAKIKEYFHGSWDVNPMSEPKKKSHLPGWF